MSGQKKLAYGTPKAKLGRKYKDVEAPEGTKTGAVVLSAPVASHSDGTDPWTKMAAAKARVGL